MTYPTDPALTQAQAQNPTLWDGLVWLYLPGHDASADIISGDVIAQNQATTIDTTTYPEGTAEVYNLAYRTGVATPLEGTTEHTLAAYFTRIVGGASADRGIIGTAPSTTWSNVSQMIMRSPGNGGLGGHIFKRGGSEVSVLTADETPVGPQLALAGRRASDGKVFFSRDAGARLWSATGLVGALTSTEPVVLGRYYAADTRRMPMALFWAGIWSRELTEAEQATLAADQYAVFRKAAAGDPPLGTVTIGTITPGATTADVPYSYSAADETGYEYRINEGAAASIGPSPATISGLTADTPYNAPGLQVRAINADGPGTWSTAVAFTTSAAADVAAPTLTGDVTFSALTPTSYTATWPAGADNVAVTGYEYQIGSTAGAWTDAGDVLSVAISGRAASTTETVYVRAYDAAGNRSTPAISGSVTTLAGITVTEPLKNNTGTVLASQTGVSVAVLQAADLVSVYEATGLTTNASGVLAQIADLSVVAGTSYHVVIKLADGSVGVTGPITAS